MATMQYDVLASQPITSTGSVLDQNGNALGRTRMKTLYAVNGGNAGSVVFKNGQYGKTLATINTAASNTAGYTIIPLPGEGILADDALYAVVTNTTSMVVFYG